MLLSNKMLLQTNVRSLTGCAAARCMLYHVKTSIVLQKQFASWTGREISHASNHTNMGGYLCIGAPPIKRLHMNYTNTSSCSLLCRREANSQVLYSSRNQDTTYSSRNQETRSYITDSEQNKQLIKHCIDNIPTSNYHTDRKKQKLKEKLKKKLYGTHFSHVKIFPWRDITSAIYHNASPHVVPYLNLIRFNKPIGTWLLYLPCTWSIALAADDGCVPDFGMFVTFAFGAWFMRGAGCIINDLWDRDFSKKLTANRPLANSQLTHKDATAFLGLMSFGGLVMLFSLNSYSVFLGASSMLLVASYPRMKRITHWPQAVLGLAFNFGTLLGWSAVRGSCDWSVCLPLYVAGISWTLIYDTIYSHQDNKDDLKVGVKSTAILFGDNTKAWLTGFGVTMNASLLMCGYFSGQTLPYYLAVAATSTHLAWMLWNVNLKSSADCGNKFNSNRYVGMLLFLGIVASTYLK